MYKELCWQYRNLDMLSAVRYGQKGITLAKKLGFKKGEAEICRFIGLTYRHYFLFSESLSWYFKALYLSTQINDVVGIGFCYDNLGVVRFNQKQLDDALNYFTKAKDHFEKANHQEGLSYAYNHISWVLVEKKQYSSALDYIQEALFIRRKIKASPEQISNTLGDVATVQIALQKYSAAKITINEGIQLARKVNKPIITSVHQLTLASLYLNNNQLDEAIAIAQSSYQIARQANNRLQRMKCASTLAKIYEKQRKYDLAYPYLIEQYALKDSLFNEEINNKTANLEAKYRFDLKERQLLEFQKRQELENKRNLDRERFLSSLLIAALLFVGVLAFFIYQKRKQDKFINEELVQKNAEISRQNQEIQEQTAQLAENNHFKDRLFSIISHDLRSPMVGLVGSLELVNEGLLSETEFRQMLPDLANNINSIQSLLDNLLAWARTQMKGIAILPEAFHIRELLDEKSIMFKKQIQSKELHIVNNVEADLQVLADKNMIDLVARNLLSNAIKFSIQGGTITMTSSRQKGYSQICITDNGIGISSENLNQLFDTQTVSTKGTAGEMGTGLGLLLSKEFIEQNGGKIWGESVVGEGSKFCFTIPE
ncbi:MAG: tetratricopeptide repeat-containing sensor histidine kinase [Haliscomenobacter sp.]|uniref:tetratricopeptide repeat-containing sensor histidine kinase n=1 Tax=Haliscomenobacter sp. TaxID=2717303 RepID=UPI0029BAB28F|nr:tetratricopeptide repeat-containing sensor histidine kinase [Haliscomenobacter sp.]MDX2069625.1 tetratricopeptide repeat-containing sensor histidine kinase [Haliscomenobacter sp.]